MKWNAFRALCRRAAALLAAAILLCPAAAAAGAQDAPELEWSGLTYIISGIGDHPVLLDGSGRDPNLSGYPLLVTDNGRKRDLTTAARQEISLHYHGETFQLTSRLEMITELLRRLHIVPSGLESMLVELSPGHIELTLASDLIYYDWDVYRAPYETVRRENPDLEPGEESVVQVGSTGERGEVYEVVWSNCAELSRQLVEVLDTAPVKEIIEYGPARSKATASSTSPASPSTAESEPKKQNVSVERNGQGGVLTLPSGETLQFSRAVSMSATAYTSGYGGAGYNTASGTPARVGAVAVDPQVIPLGSRLYIVCNGGIVYGRAVAEDTGVRGNRIDLYFNTYQECINFGRRNCMVYILE